MENRPRTSLKNFQSNRLSHPKFQNLNIEYNQLQSKYDIYKNGTPNVYKQDLQSLKTCNMKSNIKNLQLPAIDYLLQQMKNVQQSGGTNQRDYNVHPSTIQKYGNKFRNLMSDKQEIQDFLNWFNKKQKEVKERDCGASERFYFYQNLITSGFNEIISQISCISKSRSQILRMLWNKQNGEAEKIINLIHKQNTDQQKSNLQTIKSLHLGYQSQIINLRDENTFYQKKIQEATILNQSCINTMRVMRKQKKKYQKVIKQLNQNNFQLKEECLQLLQENINLVMKQKNIPYEKARVFSYQKLLTQKLKKDLNRSKGTKKIFRDIKNKAENIIQNSDLNDIQQKKQKLVSFLKARFQQNPNEKNYIMKGELSQDQDQEIKLEKNIQQVLKSRQFKLQVQSKVHKTPNFFKQAGTNTQNQSEENKKYENFAIQTTPCFQKQFIDLRRLSQDEQISGKKKLRDKKILQRHTLMMIEMNKMMEFKKTHSPHKVSKLSRFSCMNTQGFSGKKLSERTSSRFNSQIESEATISQQQQIQSQSVGDQSSSKQIITEVSNLRNKRQENIRRTHQNSIISQKSVQFKALVQTISIQSFEVKETITSNASTPKNSYNSKKKQPIVSQLQQQQFLKQLVKKYIQKKSPYLFQVNSTIREPPSTSATNKPEKHLKKILTDTFKNLYTSKKTDFFRQLIRTAKNSYGKIVYENKLVQLIAMILQHRENSLLSALSLLINIPSISQSISIPVHSPQIGNLYFKLFFILNIKNPTEVQFNIFKNYTNTQKLNSPSFLETLRLYFHENKCIYLQMKIKEFVGGKFPSFDGTAGCVGNEFGMQGANLYIQLNTLLVYILEVYASEKRNYYQSYNQIINFLADGEYLDLHIFLFLLDLLCFGQQQQKEIISTYFGITTQLGNKQQNTALVANKQIVDSRPPCPIRPKNIFYQICVRYELPLFEFIKVLKLQQFKNIHEQIQSDLIDINDIQKWSRAKQTLYRRLKIKNKSNFGLLKVLDKLDSYVKSTDRNEGKNQAFLFFYRILVNIGFGQLDRKAISQ